jgi:hypothetical protein
LKNSNIPSNVELPSVGKLIKSTFLAMIVAVIILVTVALPAEYGIDPTGVGRLIGLVEMGEIKTYLAEEAALDEAKLLAEASQGAGYKGGLPDCTPNEGPLLVESTFQEKEVQIQLLAGEGKELKLVMSKGDQVKYSWASNGGKVVFDTHADSDDVKYYNYSKGKDERHEGVLEASFDGNHGWYWKNRSFKPVLIRLNISGDFAELKLD